MQNGSEQPPNDTAFKRAIRHPKRLEILGFLAGRKIGIDEAELAEALDELPARVKYHLAVLRSAGLVAHVEDAPPRGTIERYVVAYS